MKRILALAALLLALPALGQYTPPSYAGYFLSGSTWTPLSTTSTTGAVQFTPPSIGLYCYNSSTSQWVPASSSCFGGGGTGTVTSVTFTGDGTVLSSTPSSAVTTSGTVTATLANAAQNSVLAGPATGGAGAPTYQTAPTFSAANLTNLPGASSVSNSDGTLTVTPTTGAVVASLNLAHQNTWTATQLFSALTATTSTNNFVASSTAGATNQAGSQWQFAGSSAVYARVGIGTSTTSTTLATGVNYAALVVGSAPITTFTSGTHAWLTQVAVPSMGTVTSGGATVTNTATAYFGANTASVGATNYPGIYSAGGVASGGPVLAPTYTTATNCSSSAAPAVCGSAAAGAVALPAGTGSTLTINTTAITAISAIRLQVDASLTVSGATCNSTLATLTGTPLVVTARTPGTSFTVSTSASAVITTNPLCFSYTLMN